MRVSTAASTEAVLSDVVDAFHALQGEIEVRMNSAGSGVLAKQIIDGAPADVFVSASPQWLEYLDSQGLLEADSRQPLFGNRLALIAPAGSTLEVRFEPSFSFAESFGGRLALGDPRAVPVGIYARQALERLGWWPRLEGRIAAAADATAALALVASGECEAGVVYVTDTRSSAKVEIVAVVPDHLHDSIEYGLAVVTGRGRPTVQSFVSFMRGDEAARIYASHGFLPLTDQPQVMAMRSGGQP